MTMRAAGMAVLFVCAAMADDALITTQMGRLQGRVTESGLAFLGVPFAAPPVGRLRFAVPEAAQPWEGVRDATAFPSGCLQMSERSDIFSRPEAGFSEDCLYLNVFTSKEGPSSAPTRPVMVWVHGGSFAKGSSYDYKVNGIMQNFVAKGVVFVVLQYRLGLFASGNWGLWDQLTALHWVQANIADFGGDAQAVTLMGESAGAISASLLGYAPPAQQFFHQLILQSGTAHLGGLLSAKPQAALPVLSKEVGCTDMQTIALVRCLRALPAEELLGAHRRLFEVAYAEPGQMTWTPTIDGYLIPDELRLLASTLQVKPAIIGVTDMEMAYFVDPPANLPRTRKYGSMIVHNDAEALPKFEAIAGFYAQQRGLDSAATAAVLAQYLSGGSRQNASFVTGQLIHLLSDLWFRVPALEEATHRTAIGSPVWLYSFDHFSQRMYQPDYPWQGAIHATELLFEFGIDLEVFPFERDAADARVSQLMTDIFVHFAKTGSPQRNPSVPETENWSHFSDEEDSSTFHIAAELSLTPTFHKEAFAFWTTEVHRHARDEL